MKPVNLAVSTPFGRRGGMWSCHRNSHGGIHTGDDFAVSAGTRLVAAISGTIRHRNYGSAFGRHQFAISPSPGQPFADGEVFYAHCRTRLPDGTEVNMGDFVAESGAEGNVSGPHLHFEFHPHSKGHWSCDVVADPQPVYDLHTSAPAPAPTPTPAANPVYLDKLHQGQQDSDSVRVLQRVFNSHSLPAPGNITLPITGNFGEKTATVARTCQQVHGHLWGEGSADDMGNVSVGRKQAAHLGLSVVG